MAIKQHLRKVATIVACLAVTAVFAACEKTNPGGDDDDPKGETDSKLIGTWERSAPDPQNYWHYYIWNINKDGTFYWLMSTTAEYSYKGNYSVSDGKIYFTNVVFTNDDLVRNERDSYVDYKFGTDSEGKERLEISNTGDSWMGSPWWYRTE
ncbi:MAG: hypothetical protein LBE56_03770 [Tannerella sp.]|nr:hypothetical protein [Tannerella sp.]